MQKNIYLDNGATTELDECVFEKMKPYLTDKYGNASSIYLLGQESKIAIDKARKQVAESIGADICEVYFTCSGTEANNWAIKSKIFIEPYKKHHVITSEIEHHSVLHTCEYIKKFNTQITYLTVDKYGTINLDFLEQSLTVDTNLVSIMLANNEIGTIQPIKEVVSIAKKFDVEVHSDAVQCIGHMPIDVRDLGVDMLSISAHKFGGPKGIGVLYIKNGTVLDNFLHGGAQEYNRRGSTENVASIVGMGEAISIATKEMMKNTNIEVKLRDYFIDKVINSIPDCTLNGHPEKRLSFNVNLKFKYIEGESILLLLNAKNICASSGSACTSGSLDPSHVLLAIGISHEDAHGSLRVTFSHKNTKEQVDYLIENLIEIVRKLRNISPFYKNQY